MKIDYDEYKIKIFIDSNVVLEAKPLSELPWEEIDAVGPLLVLIVPTVLQEIDSKKRDGRLAVRARSFNRTMGVLLDSDMPLRLRDAFPRVDMAFAITGKIKWETYDDLDPSEGDCRVVVEVLNSQKVAQSQKLMVSQDINPLLAAKRHGLKTFRMAEHWMADPEPNPYEKEIVKLKRQVADYGKTEPELVVNVKVPENPKVYRVAPLSPECQLDFLVELSRREAKVEQVRDRFAIGRALDYDATYDDRYEKYSRDTLPKYVETLHEQLELNFGQIPIAFSLENVGKVRADHLHVEVVVIGGWLNEKPILAGIFPMAPRPDPMRGLPNLSALHRSFAGPVPVGRHETELSEVAKDNRFVMQCADFRQGQKWEYDAIFWVDPNFSGPVKVVVNVTAANLHGVKTKAELIPVHKELISAFELIDRESGLFKKEFSTRRIIQDARAEERYYDYEVHCDADD